MGDQLDNSQNTVGRYTLLERLAVGGMAEIFLACERGVHDFERLVVIKKMLPHLAGEEQFIQMFLQEARICARINHQNVVQIIELGEEDDAPYMAMEYVHGSTLRELLVATDKRRFHMPHGVAIQMMTQAMAGAHAVHKLVDSSGKPYNLIHRDISPHNLMVTPEGHVKLLDFGIVKAEGGERTRTGVLKGKLSYMSPEQCQQQHLDSRSDIYALGICTWELLAGEKLFSGKSELQIMQTIVTGKIRHLGRVRHDIPKEIQDVVMKSLELDREKRFETADEMRRALVTAAQNNGIVLSNDTTQDFIRDMLGDKHRARREFVSTALDKTLVTAARTASTEGGYTETATRVTQMGGAAVMGGLVVTAGGTVLGIAIIALIFAFIVNGGEVDKVRDPVADAYTDHIVPTGEPVEIRFAPTVPPDILMSELDPFRRYLEVNLQTPIVFSVGESYAATAEAVSSGDVEFASLPPAMTMMTVKKHPEIELLAVKLLDGSVGTDGVLLISERSTAATALEMKGTRICYPDPNSTTGYVLPRVYLRSQGLNPDDDFIQIEPLGNHLEVIKGIVEGRCDIGGVYRGALDEADDKGIPAARTRMLAMTGRTPHDAIAAGRKSTPEQRAKLLQALLAFDPMKEFGVEALGEMEKLSGWQRPDQKAYDRLTAAIDEEQAVRASKAKAGADGEATD